MKIIKRISFVTILISLFFTFIAFAMNENENPYAPKKQCPANEVRHEDKTINYYWTWLNDGVCIQFGGWGKGQVSKEPLQRKYDMGMVSRWTEEGQLKTRDTYAGKWTQAEDGIWSFEFDDKTIPVGVTKIDDVLYAFSGFGELREGLIYYGKQKTPFDTAGCLLTGADGLADSDNPEYLKWLETQYIPACTSHE